MKVNEMSKESREKLNFIIEGKNILLLLEVLRVVVLKWLFRI